MSPDWVIAAAAALLGGLAIALIRGANCRCGGCYADPPTTRHHEEDQP